MISALINDASKPKIKIEIGFLSYAMSRSSVSLQFTFSPEDRKVSSFFSSLYESSFTNDIRKNLLAVDRKYTMLHCSACEERGYTMIQPDCLSGGRYCMRSPNYFLLTGEVMLIQTLKNKCTETILENANRRSAIWEYYWTLNASCINDFDPKCVNTILRKLNIKDEVFDCVKRSFIKEVQTEEIEPRILLQDNEILRREMSDFSKVEHYVNFPMLKINDIIYNGPLDFKQIMNFICLHVNDKLVGCKEFFIVKELEVEGTKPVYKIFFIVISILIIGVAIEFCKRYLKRKYEGEISYKIDQSVSSFLEKTGGTDL